MQTFQVFKEANDSEKVDLRFVSEHRVELAIKWASFIRAGETKAKENETALQDFRKIVLDHSHQIHSLRFPDPEVRYKQILLTIQDKTNGKLCSCNIAVDAAPGALMACRDVV